MKTALSILLFSICASANPMADLKTNVQDQISNLKNDLQNLKEISRLIKGSSNESQQLDAVCGTIRNMQENFLTTIVTFQDVGYLLIDEKSEERIYSPDISYRATNILNELYRSSGFCNEERRAYNVEFGLTVMTIPFKDYPAFESLINRINGDMDKLHKSIDKIPTDLFLPEEETAKNTTLTL